MFEKVLIANRGAIACRIIRTLRKLGIAAVAVYSDADRHSLHVEQADEAVRIGPAPAAESYLSVTALLEAACRTGAQAIHPGYGFLSENAGFAEACPAAGIVFIGPTPRQMRDFGLKHTARRLAAENGLPLLPGTGLLESQEEAARAAAQIGYPVMLKSTAGGGGIGMRVCHSAAELAGAYAAVERLSRASFGASGLYLEKFVAHARHIEVQIFGDGKGAVLALGERDCSVQRRHQKVMEETPASRLSTETRKKVHNSAQRLGQAVCYQSAGTVEFLYNAETEEFYFLEVNTRLQVEHGVTEEVTGVDLVEWMVRQAAGAMADLRTLAVAPAGWSIEARVYAEDPGKEFQPSSGRLMHVAWPAAARVETWVEPGAEVTPYYDPMLAKIIVRGADRPAALARLRAALAECRIDGIETNLEYLRQISAHPDFAEGGVSTSFLSGFDYRRQAIDVLSAGTQTTVQDYPGRIGFWHVGVPPSGPMDSLAFRMANRLVGNAEGAAGLEMAVSGPSLRFRSDAVIALAGADFGAGMEGWPVPRWQAVPVKAGSVLELGAATGAGSRAYLAVAGGIDAPLYLGSASTFILGKFGGCAGRVLAAGDVLPMGAKSIETSLDGPGGHPDTSVCATAYTHEWEIGVLYGPHGAPDFFTPEDIDTFFSTAWKVHHNSDRTGVRLIGPKPTWARPDGGEAGLHPSNIHDNAYAIGTVDFTGDMPVILGPDGPSLGGFVCPATIVDAELWKIGQLSPGDRVRFRLAERPRSDPRPSDPRPFQAPPSDPRPSNPRLSEPGPEGTPTGRARPTTPILRQRPGMVCRASGDRYLLVEYGPNVLDLNLRFRVHALETQLRALALTGILDITPGVRSLQIHYDAGKLSRDALLDALDHAESRIPDLDDLVVPSRVVHLPLSWDDPATRLAIQKYMQGVRPDAPWCPSNIEFIRRINGLESIEEVRRMVFSANYLVLGLGDVYLGAPVATPTDPRHRLVTTKYNPARTWTPENAVGIGGANLCVYGMEGPGGYQFVGRTVQMWNTWADTPWLLRFFDQIRFEPVAAGELLEIRDAFPHGKYPLRIEAEDFRLKDYHVFLRSIETPAAEFKRRQRQAFEAERERWAADGAGYAMGAGHEASEAPEPPREESLPEGCRSVCSPVTASVWNIPVETGQRVEAGQRLVVLEAMKMEIAVAAPFSGVIERLNCAAGGMVTAGQQLVTLRLEAAA